MATLDLATDPDARIRAVLFDCDGVLIDSETLAARVWIEDAAKFGYRMTPHEFARRFAGRPAEDSAGIIRRSAPRLPADFARTADDRIASLYADELEEVPGIEDLIEAVSDLPIAVASSSGLAKLRQGLLMTGLMGHFAPHVYSAEQVAQGKPAPDLFLFAAEKLGVAPECCAVIEDSIAGVTAARAAGMIAVGFTGTSPEPDLHGPRLETAGAVALAHRHAEIPAILLALSRGQDPVGTRR